MLNYKDKTVAVLGLSVEGLDTVDFFLERGAHVTCCDQRTAQELGDTYVRLEASGVSFQLGSTYLKNLDVFDLVSRTPGMSPRLPEVVAVQERGTLTSLTKLFFEYCKAPIIGVTGTKGKGTTTTLIYEMLRAAGHTTTMGGNVGMPLLSRVEDYTKNDWIVLELSSFQLEYLHMSPHIAVVQAITQEHLANFDPLAPNYHETREDYVAAKLPIVLSQRPQDYAVVNISDPTSLEFAEQTKAQVRGFSRTDTSAHAYVDPTGVWLREGKKKRRVVKRTEVQVRGDHNLENIAAASLAARAAGVPFSAIQSVASSFDGLEHRLEHVRTHKGIAYYNDTFSTVPETTIAAIASFEEPIVLIIGGSEKKSEYTELGRQIAHHAVKALVVIGETGPKIEKAALRAGYTGTRVQGGSTMHQIVRSATDLAAAGDVVLLSPAAASFDMFANYKERGNQFKDEVTRL